MTGKIRFANPGDAEAILGIYAPYIKKTAQRFFPFRQRILSPSANLTMILNKRRMTNA